MDFFANTDIGKKRKVNQDSFLAHAFSEKALLCAVFDGMGGHAGGETASRIARDRFSAVVIDTLTQKLDSETGLLDISKTQAINVLEKAVSVANGAIFETAQIDRALSGMGTTIAAILVNGEVGYALNVGDSRIYKVDSLKTEQITRDH